MNKIQKISLVGTLIAVTALCVTLPLASCSSSVEATIPPTKPTTPMIPTEPAKRIITPYNSYGFNKVFEVTKIKYGVSGIWKKNLTDKGIDLNFISYEDVLDTTSISKLVNTSFYVTDEVFNALYKAGNTWRVDLNFTYAESVASFNGSKYSFNLKGVI